MAIIPGLYGLDSSTAWRVLSKDPQKYIDRFSKDKTLQKDLEYFNKKAPTFKDVDALLKDRKALQVLLDSYGLGSEINNIGRLKKILTEDPTNPNALVNKLAESKFKTMAMSLRLDQGMDKLSQATTIATNVEEQFIQHELEESLGSKAVTIRNKAEAESDYFSDVVAKAKSVDDIFKDTRALQYLLDSYGLGASIGDAKRLKELLTEDPTKSTAQVNRLTDPRFAEMSKDLRLDQGLDTIKSDAFYEKSKQKFIQISVETAFIVTLGPSAGQAKIDEIKAKAQLEIDYFAKNAAKFNNVDTLLKDTRATQYLLDAYSLGGMVSDTATLRKVMTEDPTVKDSFVSTLGNPMLEKFAEDFRFDTGMGKLTKVDFLDTLKGNYIQNKFEEALGEQDAALRQSAYFARSVGTISGVYSILGDKILRDVTTNALSLPAQFAIQPIESQAAYLSKRIDFTKFTEAIGGTVATASQLSRAKSDFSLLQSSMSVSDQAVKQITSLQSQLNQLSADYAGLASSTNPSGSNAATIAAQRDAVPELIRYEQLMQGGANALSGIDKQLNNLLGLIDQAKKPGADLAALKSQFSTYANALNSAINSANITAPDGSTQNILLNGIADKISVIIDASGTKVELNRYDVSAVQNMIATAQTAFDAVTGSGDTANLLTAEARLLNSQDRMRDISIKMSGDITAFESKVGDTQFYASLNTAQLQKGVSSIRDALNRTGQIEELLKKIGDIATESASRTSGADRSDLEAQFENYKTQIRDLIEDTGSAGLDNFLNGSPDQFYEIVDGNTIKVKGGYNLATTIANVLDTHSISTQAGANALEIASIQATNYTDAVRNGLTPSQPIIEHALNTYDPRGRLDDQIHVIKENLDQFIQDATVRAGGKQNLLDPDQSNIVLSLSTGTSVTLRAQKSFQSNLNKSLNELLVQVSSGNINGILKEIDDTLYLVDSTKRSLDSDNRIATMELGKLGGVIDTLEKKKGPDNPYATNAYTEKFLMRYLTLNSQASTPSNYVLSLFGSTDSATATQNIMSLAFSLKA